MNKFILLFLFLFIYFSIKAEPTVVKLTIEDILRLTQDNSPDVIIAKNQYQSSWYQHRAFKAGYYPSLGMNLTLPNINRSTSSYVNPDGTSSFVKQNNMQNAIGLSVNQVVPFTGGQFSINSSLQRIEIIGDNKSRTYLSTPFGIGFSQPIGKPNPLKWNKRIETLRYEESKKAYVTALEDANLKGINYYFSLLSAQISLKIQQINLANADTLYKISLGRYNNGIIGKSDLLQMELNYLNASSSLIQSKTDLDRINAEVCRFLGFNEDVTFELVLPETIPVNYIDSDKALSEAFKNNPILLSFKRQLIEAEKQVADGKMEKYNILLSANYYLNKTSKDLNDIYVNPEDQQTACVTISLPLVDWGQSNGRYKMAKSNLKIVEMNTSLAKLDFEQNLKLKVNQFNMQKEQLIKAAKTDTIAQIRFEIVKYRFLTGKLTATDLSLAISEKDAAILGYISVLRSYWQMLYEVRRICLFDFDKNQPIINSVNEDEEPSF